MTCGYTYDDDGLLTNVDGLALQRNVPNGLLTGTTLGSVTDTYTYNSFGEVSNYTAAYPAGLSCQIGYTRDAVGRITMGFRGQAMHYAQTTKGRLDCRPFRFPVTYISHLRYLGALHFLPHLEEGPVLPVMILEALPQDLFDLLRVLLSDRQVCPVDERGVGVHGRQVR